MGRKLAAAVLGGLAFFLWSFVAHDLLPLGKTGIREIPNEQAILDSMKANMPEEGLYLLPGLDVPENATRAQQSAAHGSAHAQGRDWAFRSPGVSPVVPVFIR
jgi:hypothetical protein